MPVTYVATMTEEEIIAKSSSPPRMSYKIIKIYLILFNLDFPAMKF